MRQSFFLPDYKPPRWLWSYDLEQNFHALLDTENWHLWQVKSFGKDAVSVNHLPDFGPPLAVEFVEAQREAKQAYYELSEMFEGA